MKLLKTYKDLPDVLKTEIVKRVLLSASCLFICALVCVIFSAVICLILGSCIFLLSILSTISYMQSFFDGSLRLLSLTINSKSTKNTIFSKKDTTYLLYCTDNLNNTFEVSVNEKYFNQAVLGDLVSIYLKESQINQKSENEFIIASYLKLI